MDEEQFALRLSLAGTAVLCAAEPEIVLVDCVLAGLLPGRCAAGRARTARTPPEHNAAVHRAAAAASSGEILVVDAGAERSLAMLGDLLADFCIRRGVAGAIVRGSVRDVANLRECGFPIWCSSVNARPAGKSETGEIDVPLSLGSADVRPGDWVVADDDGIAVLPERLAQVALAKADEVLVRERKIRVRIAAGETTCEIFGIER